MKPRTLFLALIVAASAAAVVVVEPATAQGMKGKMGPGMMQGEMGQQPKGQGMPPLGDMGSDMMCPMMRSGMMQGGMMGSEMMGSGMMGRGMNLFGSRVRPVMNLSVDDVRGYLASQLEHLNNKRLKLGDVNSGDATITADIVTVDNSLVQRLKIDRHSGAITYEE
jgi:hypothetical protein